MPAVRCEEGDWWLGVWWGHCFSLEKWTIQMDDGERCPTMWMYLVPLNCTVKYGWNSMLYIVWLFTTINSIKNMSDSPIQINKIKIHQTLSPLCSKSSDMSYYRQCKSQSYDSDLRYPLQYSFSPSFVSLFESSVTVTMPSLLRTQDLCPYFSPCQDHLSHRSLQLAPSLPSVFCSNVTLSENVLWPRYKIMTL